MIRLRARHRRDPLEDRSGRGDTPIPLTSTTDGRTHLVTVADHARTLTTGAIAYTTLCGRTVSAAAMITPQGGRCTSCHHHPAAEPTLTR